MPAEHGPQGCTVPRLAMRTSPNPAVREGRVEVSGGKCGCRVMLNGELVGEAGATLAPTGVPGATTGSGHGDQQASSSPTQGGQSVTFDPEAYQPGQQVQGTFASKEVKAQLWVNKIPFEVAAPPQQRKKQAGWVVARKDGSMPSDFQWVFPIRLLQYRNDGTGSFGYRMQADGEGGQEVEEYVLAFDGGSTWRDRQMTDMAQFVQETGRGGPYRLDQGQTSGQGAAPWIIRNWRPEDCGFPPAQAVASSAVPAAQSAPTAATASPAPPPVPSAPPPVPQAPPPPPADPYQYAERYDGVKIRWQPGMADWEPVPQAGPPVVQAQPLASTRTVVGLNPGDRMEGAARVAVEQADGREIRQVHYQGDGVVVTPQGVPTQLAAGVEPKTRAEAISGNQAPQTASTATGALGVEEPAPVAPGPSPAPTGASMASVIRQAYDNGSPVQVELRCDHADHTERDHEGKTVAAVVRMPAFWDPTANLWKQTHNCPGSRKVRVLDATAAVKSAAGVG